MKKYFMFDELGTNLKREVLAGCTTFLAMAYILFVNANTLSATGMDKGAIFVATALAAAVGSIVMGIVANYPVALAPGMGINAFFAYTVVIGWGIPWQTALSGTLVSGLIFILITLLGLREKLINAIPFELKMAVAAGIGLFIAFVGLQGSGIIVASEGTLVGFGDLMHGATLLSIVGLIITVILMARKVPGAIFIGMIVTSAIGIIFGVISKPDAIIGSIPSIDSTFGQALFNLDEIFSVKMIAVILTFLFVDFFDTAGTLVAVATQAGIMKDGKLPRAGKALLADSSATVVGAIFGTSTTTSYVESTAGVAVGGRSGFTAVVVGILFLLSLFFSPLLSVVTSAVTAPALIIVGVLMVASLKDIDWADFEIAVPAFLTVLMMPLSYSIANGIACGFIFYVLIKLVVGKYKEVSVLTYAMAVIFVLYFIYLL